VLSEPRGRRVRPSNAFLHALAEFPKPLIAAVDGHAIGVGFTLTLLCDLVYAATTALFRAPFLPMGLVPEAGSTLVLSRLVGHQQAAEIFLFGEEISADRARRLGLVNEVLPSEHVLERALARANQLCDLDPAAVRQTLSLLGLRRAGRDQMTKEEPIFEALLARLRDKSL
jgi:enoyl-CoA hydratase/carnithine racemase